MHNLLKPLLLVWQPANLILTHNTRIQLPHQPLIKHASIFFIAPCCLSLKSSRANEAILNNSRINYNLCSKQMLNSVWKDRIPAVHLHDLEKLSSALWLELIQTCCFYSEVCICTSFNPLLLYYHLWGPELPRSHVNK